MARRRRVVLIQGAFEILNYGHIRAFEFAKAQGDYLIVALNSNKLIRRYKGREPVVPWRQKKLIIESLRMVGQVVVATEFSPLKLLKRHGVDVYVMSREWEGTKAAEVAYMRAKGGRVAFSRRFAGISTTLIKERLLREHLDADGGDDETRGSEPIRAPASKPGRLCSSAAADHPRRGATPGRAEPPAPAPVRPRAARANGAGVLWRSRSDRLLGVRPD